MNKQLSEEIKELGLTINAYAPNNMPIPTNWDMKSNKVFEYEPSNFAADYRLMGKKQLYDCAIDNRIPSRSKMRKKELLQALVNL